MAAPEHAVASGGLPDLVRGASLAFRGFGMLFGNRALFGLAMVPAALSAIGIVAVVVSAFAWGPDLLQRVWARPDAWYVVWLWYVALSAMVATVALIGMVSLPPLLAAPFQEPISARAEKVIAGEDTGRERPLAQGLVVAVADQVRKVALLLTGYALLLVVWIIPVAGTVLWSVLAWLWTALWCAAEYVDVPMGRHRYRFAQTRGVLRERLGLALGFGGAVSVMLMVPLVNFLVVPAAVVGGTALFLELRRENALPPELAK
jgi:CysZ protein